MVMEKLWLIVIKYKCFDCLFFFLMVWMVEILLMVLFRRSGLLILIWLLVYIWCGRLKFGINWFNVLWLLGLRFDVWI